MSAASNGKTRRGRVWTGQEIGRLRSMAGSMSLRAIAKRLRRPYCGVRAKSQKLGLSPKRFRWTAAKVSLLGRVWTTESLQDVKAAFPNLRLEQVAQAAKYYGYRRPTPSLVPTGIVVIDQIKARALKVGLSMRELDRLAHTREYFSKASWCPTRRPRPQAVGQAVVALGGELYVEWED